MSYLRKFISLFFILFVFGCYTCATPQSSQHSSHSTEQQVFEKVFKATVAIRMESELVLLDRITSSTTATAAAAYSGTGFIIDQFERSTVILTASHMCRIVYDTQIKNSFKQYDSEKHIVKIATLLTLRDSTGEKHVAEMFLYHKGHDLCIMISTKINAEPLKIVQSAPYIGQKVTLAGYPRGIGLTITGGLILSEGRFSGTFRMSDGLVSYGFALPAAPGNSGGPIVDQNGDVVSVMHHIHYLTDHVSFGSILLQTQLIRNAYIAEVFRDPLFFKDFENAIIKTEEAAKTENEKGADAP